MRDFPAVNEVYARMVGEARPARSTVAVSGLPRGVLVEIDAVATVDKK
jgi:2-iminobutanoate/2-iminopropanoate deaminase